MPVCSSQHRCRAEKPLLLRADIYAAAAWVVRSFLKRRLQKTHDDVTCPQNLRGAHCEAKDRYRAAGTLSAGLSAPLGQRLGRRLRDLQSEQQRAMFDLVASEFKVLLELRENTLEQSTLESSHSDW